MEFTFVEWGYHYFLSSYEVFFCFVMFSIFFFRPGSGYKMERDCLHALVGLFYSEYIRKNLSSKFVFIYLFFLVLSYIYFFFFCFFVYHDCSPERKSLVTHIIFFFNMRMNSSYMPLLYSPYCWPIQYKCGR